MSFSSFGTSPSSPRCSLRHRALRAALGAALGLSASTGLIQALTYEGASTQRDRDSALLADRVWINRLPRDDRDMIGKLVLMTTPQGKFGVIDRGSVWRHVVEVFTWKRKGRNIRMFFPQERERMRVLTHTYPCPDEAPGPLELCLDLEVQDRHGYAHSVRMYSRYDWKVGEDDQSRAVLASRLANHHVSLPAELSPAAPSVTPDIGEHGSYRVRDVLLLGLWSAAAAGLGKPSPSPSPSRGMRQVKSFSTSSVVGSSPAFCTVAVNETC